MKKNFLSIILVVSMIFSLLSFLPALASSITYEDGIYKITSGEDFKKITDMNGVYWVMGDITLPEDYIPIGTQSNPFKGKLLGRPDGNIGQVTITANIKNQGSSGLVANMAGGVISDLILEGSVTADKRTIAGGFVGYMIDGKIENCINRAKISSTYEGNNSVYLGGIIGLIKTAAKISVISCENYGKIISEGSTYGSVGGIVGGSYNGYTVIDSCKNEGNITAGADFAGGITGIAYSDIINCANFGNITNSKGSASGICDTTNLSVKRSFNKGDVNAKENASGISQNAKIEVCYNSGKISGYKAAGISYDGQVTYSYNIGEVAGSFSSKGVASKSHKTNYSINENGLTEENMKDISSFPEFDEGMFRIDAESEYKYPQIYANPYGTIMKDYPSFNPDRIIFEAEDLEIFDAFFVENDPDASGGKVVAPVKGMNVTESKDVEKSGLSVEFLAPEDGKYFVWIKVKILDNGGDTIHVAKDKEAYKKQQFSIDPDNYVWFRAYSSEFTKGVHKVSFYPRERKLKIDKVVITNKASSSVYDDGEYKENGEDKLFFPIPSVQPTKGEHPRVLLTKEDIPQIRENGNHPEHQPTWNKMLSYANRTDVTGILPPNTGENNHNELALNVAKCAAMDYIINGNTENGKKAVSIILNYLKTVEYTSTDDYNTVSSTVFSVALIYDWCYDFFTAKDKEFIIDTVLFLAGNYYEIGWPPVLQMAWGGHGAEKQLIRDLVAFGIACYDENPYIYNTAAGRLEQDYLPVRKYFLYSGQKPLYGSSYGPYRMDADATALHMMGKLIDGKNYWENDNLRYIPYWYIYATRPDGFYMVDGDGSFDKKAAPTELGDHGADTLYSMIGSWYKDGYIKYAFLNEREKLDPTRWVEFLVINDPNIEPIPFDNLPLSRYFPYPAGEYIARTGWEMGKNSDDVVVTMKLNLATIIDHNHIDTGEFEIYYKGALAVDSGYYQTVRSGEENNVFGTLYWNNYYKQTVAHNCMLVYDPNEPLTNFKYSSSSEIVTNSGGQLVIPAGDKYEYPDETEAMNYSEQPGLNNSKLLGNEHGPDEQKPEYTYLSGDIARAYSDKVKDYERSFMFLNLKEDNPDIPAVLIVFDHIVSSNPEFKKTYLLHGANAPQINGTRTVLKRTELGYNGKLVNDTLLPKADNVKITQVGEHPDEFWAGDKLFKTYPYVGNNAEQGGIRTEISPLTPSAEDYFLNVMQVSDADSQIEPLQATLIETNTHKGVKIADRVVLFGMTKEKIASDVTFNFDGDGEFKITVAGLKEGTWEVKKDSSLIKDAVVTESGTIAEFKGESGNYTLTYKNENSVREKVEVSYEYVEAPIKIRVNNFYVHTENPFVENGRIMVPLRGVGDALNAKITWNEETNTAVVEKYGRIIEVKPDSNTAYVAGQKKELDVPAKNVNGTIFVPLRFISESLYANVKWYDYTKTVVISDTFSPPLEGYIGVAAVDWDAGSLADEGTTGYATIDNNDATAFVTHMNEEGNKWLKYDFGEVVSVDKMEILWTLPHQRYFVYDVLSSEDGVNWTTHVLNAKSEVVSQEKSNEFQVVDFKGIIKARYIQLNAYRNTKHHAVNIKEVRFK